MLENKKGSSVPEIKPTLEPWNFGTLEPWNLFYGTYFTVPSTYKRSACGNSLKYTLTIL